MAKEETKVEVIKHENIFEALSAFQGENPEIKKTAKVEFEAKGQKVSFMYSPLDEVLSTVRPLLAKHGLSVTFGGDEKGRLICSLYHSTYKYVMEDGSGSTDYFVDGAKSQTVTTLKKLVESNVIRSLPIEVTRKGDMKDIGSSSTYARRYMLAEVLGIASDEDKDAEIEEKSQKNAEAFAYTQVEKQLKSIKTLKEVNEKITFLEKELATAKEGKKAPSLGLKAEQYERLIKIGEGVLADISGDIKVTPEESADTGAVDPKDLPEDLGGAK